jgi:hypothetical protein
MIGSCEQALFEITASGVLISTLLHGKERR